MLQFCVGFVVFLACILVSMSDHIDPSEVVSTTCTMINMSITDKSIINTGYPRMKYHYDLIIRLGNNTLMTVSRTGFRPEMRHDRELVGEIVNCYFVRSQLQFSQPYTCTKACAWSMTIAAWFILVIVGAFLILMIREDLSF